MSARRIAWLALRGARMAPTREVQALAERFGLDDRDRGLARHLVSTCLRRQATLRAILARICNDARRRPPKPESALGVHLGLVQLFFCERIPDHAAVAEMVELTRELLGETQARATNALLRAALRLRRPGHSGDRRRDLVRSPWHLAEPYARDPQQHPHLWCEDALSLPASLSKRWTERYGFERAGSLALQALEEPPLSVRLRPGALAPACAKLGEGIGTSAETPDVVLVPSERAQQVLASADFASGRLTIQGATALRAARLMGAKAGEVILDLCAAPGGKSAVMAESGARVLALDSPGRLIRARQTIARLGLDGAVWFAAAKSGRGIRPVGFDGVLVDAPCSNTGVLAARPEARWRFGPKAMEELNALQDELLEAAVVHVRPGGRLVYSTCSIEPSENAARVRAFAARHPEFELETDFEALADHRLGPVDGGYAARLVRRSAG